MRWIRDFADSIGGRKRKSNRYEFAASLSAKCSSWPQFATLMSADLSSGGMFIQTTEKAKMGERVELNLRMPDGSNLYVPGTVVNILDEERAKSLNRAPGLGIKLADLTPLQRANFESVLARAKEMAPRPGPAPAPSKAKNEAPFPSLAQKPRPASAPASPQSEFPSLSQTPTPTPTLTPTAPPSSSKGPAPKPKQKPKQKPAPATESLVDFDDFEVLEEEAVSEAQVAISQQPTSPLLRPEDKAPPPSSHPTSKHPPSGPVLGIDLGTTYTSVAAVVGKKVTIIERDDGSKSTPSVVSFDRDGKIIIGAEARRRIATDPARTVVSPKRILGRNYNDREVQTFVGQAAYRTSEGPNGSVIAEFDGNQYPFTQIMAFIMRDVKELAEKKLGQEITQAVVSVPISYEDSRVEVLRRTGRIAGLDIVAVIDEPSAAALANRFDPNFGGIVGVYDFGGGTFDFSVVDVSHGDFRVLATAGDTWLGGDDFDRVLAEAAANQFWRAHKVDIRQQASEWQRLLYACEQAKRQLSTDEKAVIHVPNILRTAEGMIDLKIAIDQNILARACAAIIQRSLDTCGEALALLDIKPSQLTAVYLSGGTTYIPAVRQGLQRYFGVDIRTGVPPEHAVCLGAAIHAAQIQFNSNQTLETR